MIDRSENFEFLLQRTNTLLEALVFLSTSRGWLFLHTIGVISTVSSEYLLLNLIELTVSLSLSRHTFQSSIFL